jgi:hypothetical protein
LINGQSVGALMTFPERDGFYPLVQSGHDLGIAMPDGTPLVPMKAIAYTAYWGGAWPVPYTHWYALRPRDPAGSRALAACSEEAARAILAGAGDVDAVRRALPAVTDPVLLAGVAAMATTAAGMQGSVARIRGHLVTALGPVVESSMRDQQASSLATLFGHDTYFQTAGVDLGQQVLDVSRYLFADDTREPATPARSGFPWEMLLGRIGDIVYRVLASGTPKEHREQLVRVLELWAKTAFPDNLQRVRSAVFAFPGNSDALLGTERYHADRLVTDDNRYFVRSLEVDARVIEATRDGTFRLPMGARLVDEQPVAVRFDRAAIDRALSLSKERQRVELDPAFVEHVARETGLSTTAAILLWSAGYEPWLVGEKARERLGIARNKLDAAERELKGKKLGDVYARAMPADPAQMFTLDGAAALASAWNAMNRT